jgi:hypothetical protein
MAGQKKQTDFCTLRGEAMTAFRMRALGGLAILGAGLALAGCKSAPDLSAADAQKLIQAKYDQDPPVATEIRVDDTGMQQGVQAKYWDRSKAYPNRYWADFKLSDDGKKAVKLQGGGDTIEWRPDNPGDKNFSIMVTTVVMNHLKARDVQDPESESDGTKTVVFNEADDLTGVPQPLQDMAHNPGNRLATKRTATFSLQNGAWKLDSIT